jgi:hypothetical protein
MPGPDWLAQRASRELLFDHQARRNPLMDGSSLYLAGELTHRIPDIHGVAGRGPLIAKLHEEDGTDTAPFGPRPSCEISGSATVR